MKNVILKIFVMGGVVLSGSAMAVPYTFNKGELASAQEVNDNFESLEKRALSRFDYRDFATPSNVLSKTFVTSEPGCGHTETRLFNITTNGDSTEIKMTRQRYDASSVICQTRIFNYLSTADNFLLLSMENWNATGTVYKSVDSLAVPAIRRTSRMSQGAVFGNGTTSTNTSAADVTINTGIYLETTVALGLEDVNVPAGNYSNCLKIATDRKSNTFNSFQRFAWLCKGAGEVRRMQFNDDNTIRVWELSSVETGK